MGDRIVIKVIDGGNQPAQSGVGRSFSTTAGANSAAPSASSDKLSARVASIAAASLCRM